MSEPEIRLPTSTRHCNTFLRDCKWKLKTFVQRDAYTGYDYAASYAHPPCDEIREFHINAINKEMRARSPRKAWVQFINQPLPELSAIPYSVNLIDGSVEQVQQGLGALRNLVIRITKTPGLTEMATSKVLYLLRPNFVAIADEYVRTCLAIRRTDPGETMIAVQQGIRELESTNRDPLDELYQFANSLPPIIADRGPFKGRPVPVRLTKIRILDILLWTDVAIHRPGTWRQWYLEEVVIR